jgi:hypothetical protein
MSQAIDHIFAEVCLDERVSDGVFRLEEEQHMNALRDHLCKRGLTIEDAISVTNRMMEGRFPERQAYNKDGILVTFPTPKHKAKAIAAKTHFEKNPNPQAPPKEPAPEPTPKSEPVAPQSTGPEPKSVNQGGQILSIEPAGPKPPEPPPEPPISPVNPPNTPEKRAAEKTVVQQMMATDDYALMSKYHPSIPESCVKQLSILREHAITKGLNEASEFLSQYVKQ